jgi:hypothetical protein
LLRLNYNYIISFLIKLKKINTTWIYFVPVWLYFLFSYLAQPVTIFVYGLARYLHYLRKKYDISNSSSHFGSCGRRFGPYNILLVTDLFHILPCDPQCHELFAIYYLEKVEVLVILFSLYGFLWSFGIQYKLEKSSGSLLNKIFNDLWSAKGSSFS